MKLRTILFAALAATVTTGISSALDMTAADYAALFSKVNNAWRWGKDDALRTLNYLTSVERRQASGPHPPLPSSRPCRVRCDRRS